MTNYLAGICDLQHASADVERMILGNKCDITDKRQVSKERGEQVNFVAVANLRFIFVCYCRHIRQITKC